MAAGAVDGDGAGAAARTCTLLADARGLRQSGIGRYLREILARVLADPRFTRVTLVGREDEVRAFVAEHGSPPHVRVVPFPHHFYSAAGQVRWAALRRRGDLAAEVAFFPHYDVPLAGVPGRGVVCVQDLNHYRLPELFPAWKRALGRVVLGRAVRDARRVIVPSAATRGDLLAAFPGISGKVTVIPHGASPAPAGAPRAASVAGIAAAELAPYLLCLGNRKPHKNFRTAVEALALLRRDDPSLRLVVAGETFPEGDGVREAAEALGVGAAVLETGPVSEAELRALYDGAECLLVPSLYEGFGLTPLEAMLAGIPVVSSPRASLPEVVGDAGTLVADPLDAAEWAAAVDRLRRSPGLRAEHVRRGRERAREFTWDRAAERTVHLFLQTAARAG